METTKASPRQRSESGEGKRLVTAAGISGRTVVPVESECLLDVSWTAQISGEFTLQS